MVENRGGHLRADAQRNRAAIVAAARAAVEESGDEVSLDRIAQGAQVTARTLFRHFPSRQDLLAAILDDYVTERVEPVLRRAAADSDPSRALATVLRECTAAFVDHPPMFELVDGGARTGEITSRYRGTLAEILARAQAAGSVRADLTPDDVLCLITMLVASAGHVGGDWPRHLALIVDGMSPRAASAPLPPSGRAHGTLS